MLEIDKKYAKKIAPQSDEDILANIRTLLNAHNEMDGWTFYEYFYPDFNNSNTKYREYVSGKFKDFRDNLDYYLANLDYKRTLIFCAGLRKYAVDRVDRLERLYKTRLNKESEV